MLIYYSLYVLLECVCAPFFFFGDTDTCCSAFMFGMLMTAHSGCVSMIEDMKYEWRSFRWFSHPPAGRFGRRRHQGRILLTNKFIYEREKKKKQTPLKGQRSSSKVLFLEQFLFVYINCKVCNCMAYIIWQVKCPK